MLGKSILGTQILNGAGDGSPVTVLSSGQASLEGVNLSTFGIGVRKRNIDNAAKRVIKTENVPRGDGLIIIDSYFEEKNLEFVGKLRTSTAEEMGTKMDQLKKLLATENAVLEYNIRGIQRRHVVNCTNISEVFADELNWHITVRPLELKFAVFSGFGTDLQYTARAEYAQTSNDLTFQITNSGTRKAKFGSILVYEGAANVETITLTNITNGRKIKVTTSLSDGDVLEIDEENSAVKKNGSTTGVDYDGYWPGIEVGLNTFRLQHEGSTPAVEFDGTFKFKQTYL